MAVFMLLLLTDLSIMIKKYRHILFFFKILDKLGSDWLSGGFPSDLIGGGAELASRG